MKTVPFSSSIDDAIFILGEIHDLIIYNIYTMNIFGKNSFVSAVFYWQFKKYEDKILYNVHSSKLRGIFEIASDNIKYCLQKK